MAFRHHLTSIQFLAQNEGDALINRKFNFPLLIFYATHSTHTLHTGSYIEYAGDGNPGSAEKLHLYFLRAECPTKRQNFHHNALRADRQIAVIAGED